ncbi:MAG: response regulator transcription factor, partial [Corynebacterium sp.]|uniref:response regulator n=1 Tax=Corynebacterium sp. TaxID=1720 RepID=UPI0026DF1D52
MSEQIRVIVIDDDPMVRTAVRMIMGTASDIEVVADAGEGSAGLELVREHRPDVLLCDIRMPRMDGLTVLTELRATGDATPVIMLTTFNTDDYVVRAFQLGAQGFLLKDADPRDMVQAIRDVRAGRPALSAGAVETLIGTVQAGPARDHHALALVDTLTEREREVAILLASGASNADIARQAHMAVATVKANMSRIFNKLGVDNR